MAMLYYRIVWRVSALRKSLINRANPANSGLWYRTRSTKVEGAKTEEQISKHITSNGVSSNETNTFQTSLRDAFVTPLRVYGHAQSRRPYTTQVVASLFIYAIGDIAAQYIEISGKDNRATCDDSPQNVSGKPRVFDRLDAVRLVRTMIIGAVVSIPGYRWMMYLSNHFNLKSKPGTIAYKILINQFVWSPFIGVYFFSMQSLLSGQSIDSTWDRVVQTVPVTWQNSWKFWPIVMAVNLTLVRPQSRSIFAICAGIIWQTYLCMVNQREVERVAERHTQDVSVAA